MTTKNLYTLLGLMFLAILLLITGHMDLDWMIVAPRFNTWYYTVEYWEFAPYFKLNWHLAYLFTIVRTCLGWLIIGFVTSELRHLGDSS